jgi:glycosyltransferase involved in cell wall biosynthesis
MRAGLKVALFSDSHYEANGVARTTMALERYAARRDMPLLSVHAGPATRLTEEGSILRLELKRWNVTSFGIEHDLRFDLAMWRHTRRVARELTCFRPDVLHFTGPSDIGQLGAYLGYRLGIPMIASWHTNLHEYAARRLRLPWMREQVPARLRRSVEERTLQICLLFYKIPRAILAPHDDLLKLLAERTGKPVFLMSRGVDTEAFTPAKRRRNDPVVNIGYVGRLSPEKTVRALASAEEAIRADNATKVHFTIVGDGSEREWLRQHMREATFTGTLRGEALASAYADMDLFAFPSETETVGNVVLEAMASGVPVVAMARGGPRLAAQAGPWASFAQDHHQFVNLVRGLVRDGERRRLMGLAARARAVEMSWDRVFDDVYHAYEVAVSLAKQPTLASVPEQLTSRSQCAKG